MRVERRRGEGGRGRERMEEGMEWKNPQTKILGIYGPVSECNNFMIIGLLRIMPVYLW